MSAQGNQAAPPAASLDLGRPIAGGESPSAPTVAAVPISNVIVAPADHNKSLPKEPSLAADIAPPTPSVDGDPHISRPIDVKPIPAPPTPARPAYVHRKSSVPQAIVAAPSATATTTGVPSSGSDSLHPDAVHSTVNVPNTAASEAVVPATKAHLAPDHALPTAPGVHPAKQQEAIDDGHASSETIAREVEKAKADKREMQGKLPKGTIVEGMEDDKLFMLLRKFDQQVTHTLIMTTTNTHPREPDLRRSTLPNVPFSSDVLKANLERLYASGGIGLTRAIGEIARLRSWAVEERKRTTAFCVTYFACWAVGFAIPALLVFFCILVVSPESRWFFFPPVPPQPGMPPSATDPLNRKGDESLLGGVDNPVQHRSRAEQIEEQSWEFRQLAQTFAVRLAVNNGKGKQQGNAALGEKDLDAGSDSSSSSSSSSDDEEPFVEETFQDASGDLPYAEGEHPKTVARQIAAVHGRGPPVKENGTVVVAPPTRKHRAPSSGATELIKTDSGKVVEKPMSEKKRKHMEAKAAKAKRDQLVGKYLKLTQDGLGDFADIMECFANALLPPQPYPQTMARYKLAGAIGVPLIIVTAVVPAWIWHRLASFTLGFAFFGQPLINRGIAFINEKVPNLAELLDLRNSLLSGVPTNDQLVLHLLRVGERSHRPLPRPPPPPLAGTPKEQIKDTAPNPDDELVDEAGNPIDPEDLHGKDKTMHRAKSKIAGGLKGLSKRMAAFHADVSVDGTKKAVGSTMDKMIWGSALKDDDHPEIYPCRINGVKGRIVIDPTDVRDYAARIRFEPAGVGKTEKAFDRIVSDIVELKKSGISIPRAALGWISGADIESQTLWVRMKTASQRKKDSLMRQQEREMNGSGKRGFKDLGVEDGDVYQISELFRRDQLFDRLVSLGPQRWEVL